MDALDFFTKNVAGYAGIYGDKGLLGDIGLPAVERVCNSNNYTVIDLGETFVISKNKYC